MSSDLIIFKILVVFPNLCYKMGSSVEDSFSSEDSNREMCLRIF